MKKTIIITILIILGFNNTLMCQDQKFENWTEKEKAQYQKLTELAQYVNGKEKSKISNEVLFDKYIEFDYVLKDTSKTRIEKRIQAFDTLFYYFRKPIDSLGIENLDAKPIRFYKEHKIYKPFDKELAKESISGEKMYTHSSNVFVYFKKKEPENPLGTLGFDPETNKLVAWIMIDQSGYKYFLTFNLF